MPPSAEPGEAEAKSPTEVAADVLKYICIYMYIYICRYQTKA